MKFAISVPRCVVTDRPLRTPLVITLTASREEASRCGQLSNIAGLWAYVSLMSADGTLCLVPPHEDLLRGKRANSVQARRPKDASQTTLGRASFSDLIVTKPGRYRFRINIVDMTRSSSSDPEGAAKMFPALYSNTFEAVDLGELGGQDLLVNEVRLDL